MRMRFALILLLGTAALPATLHAQYPATGYYYPTANGYRPVYPNYQGAGYPATGYYYPQPMPRYVPTYPPNYQGMPAYPARSHAWQGGSTPGETHVIISQTPIAAPSAVVVQNPDNRKATKPAAVRVPATEPPVANVDSLIAPSTRALLGAPVAGTTLPQPGETPQPAPVTVSTTSAPRGQRLSIFGDFLYWNVHGVDGPFAQPFDGIDPIFSVPRGPVAVVSPQFQTGFRAGGSVSLSENCWVVGTFTYFYSQRGAQAAAGDGLVLHNFLAFPNTANSAVDSLTATADYRIRLMMADIDVKCAIVNNDRLSLNWVTGVRYAHIDQNVLTTFQLTGTTTVDSKINFDAFGPRVGLDGKYQLRGGFYGYGQGMVDLMFGQFRGSYEERNVFTGLVGLTTINSNRVVPVLELEIGAGWQSANGRFRVSGGYYVGSWFNTMTTTSLAGAIGNVNFTTNGNNFRDNIVFDGLVSRFEFRY